MSQLVDSHCHLDFPEFADDLEGVLARAGNAGVGMCVTICTRLSRFDAVLAIAERFDNIYCSVGVHPHEAESEGQRTADRLIELAAHPKVIGIGETGLDFYYDRSPRDRQKVSFRAHIDAARETGLPLIVHARDADTETADILAEGMSNGAYTGLMHCFSSGPQLAEKALEIGLYLSFSGIATFRTAQTVRDIARDVPLERLLVETDAPFLAPVPHRGKRNEPAFVADTAAVVADLKGLEPDELADATTDNFFRLFSRADRVRMRAA